MNSELKPCPFCGSGAEIDHWIAFANVDRWGVRCLDFIDCGAEVMLHDTEDEAISAWNRRTPNGI